MMTMRLMIIGMKMLMMVMIMMPMNGNNESSHFRTHVKSGLKNYDLEHLSLCLTYTISKIVVNTHTQLIELSKGLNLNTCKVPDT